MKVLQIISGLNIFSGGPSKSVYNLTKQLRYYDIDAQILTLKSNNPNDKNISEENFIYTYSLSKFNFLLFSKPFLNFLVNNVFDIYHGHGLWQIPIHNMVKIAGLKKIPYVISPRGMLRPWALERRSLKKKIALKLYQKKDLDYAACLHATSQKEAEEILDLGFKNPVAVIPNGIDLTENPLRTKKSMNLKKTILYLSRIFPMKGLEELITAWSIIKKTDRKDWKIKIVGNGEEKYINELKILIAKKKLENEIELGGPQYGKEKIDTLHSSDLFVLPTYGENFGMAIAEALACGLPVITTKGAPWHGLQTYNAGWWIDIGAAPLAEALTEAMRLSDDERKQMGLNGRKLVEENYSIEIVAKQMIRLYEWILYNTKKPEFIK